MVVELFGPYELQELLGRGGMGEVHRAYDTVRRRVVALKRLRPEYAADERVRARFLSECRRTAQLSEAHVIPIHHSGEIEGRLYLDMRLVDGRDLGEVLAAHGPMTPVRAVAVIGQVAAALDAAHGAGLVHRDVKPSNVLLTDDGHGPHCYLADFGVAAAMGGGGPHTTTGTTVGTIAYLAPERLLGGPTDHRVDVYSLACLVYETLTGLAPFQADEVAALMYAHLSREPPRASERVPTVPAHLDEVVARGMAKDPDRRYQSAGELAAAAAAALRGPGRTPSATAVTVSVDLPRPASAAMATTGASVRRPGSGRRSRRLVSRLFLAALVVLAAGAVAVGVDLLQSVEAVRVEAEPATSTGEDPFVPPDANAAPGSPTAPSSVAGGSSPGGGTHPPADVPVSGDTVGLYGGTGAEACDSDELATHLEAHPATAMTWAGAQGIEREDIRSFLVSLTPVVLRADTAVTNHGHRDGRARAFQSVLQAGTAVLVDDRGVPRVRCSCGNPLGDPAPRDRARYEGQTWPELESRPVTVVRPAPTVVEDFVIVDQTQDATVAAQRPRGSRGDEDGPTDPGTVQVALDFSPEAAAQQADQGAHASTSASETGTGSATSAPLTPTGSDDESPVDPDTTSASSTPSASTTPSATPDSTVPSASSTP
ncbi:serine/threonine-protein kinase, partial [Geodermatophilus poikilotrophus]